MLWKWHVPHLCNLSFIKTKKALRRQRFTPRFLLAWVAIILLFCAGCTALPRSTSNLRIYTPTPIKKTPWIEHEIRAFLGLAPVREALGFDPLNHESPITIKILEERLNERDALKLFGRTDNAQVSIKGYLFPEDDGVTVGDTIQVNPKVRVDRQVNPHPQRRAMLDQLLADPELLALYRNLLVAHEVAHVGEWYALRERGEVVQYTGHGISNRVEMRILGGLLAAGYIDGPLFSRTLNFYVHFLNNENEAPESIAAYARTQRGRASGPHDSRQAVP